jgi:hypothetical protein
MPIYGAANEEHFAILPQTIITGIGVRAWVYERERREIERSVYERE